MECSEILVESEASNQCPETSLDNMECNGIPVGPEETFEHEIVQLIEKENFSGMMDLQDIAESDMKDLASGSSQHTCFESSWQDVMNAAELGQDKPEDKVEYNGNMTPCPLPNSVEVESKSGKHSDEAMLETAFETNAGLVEYSDISSCSDSEGNLDCNFNVNVSGNQGNHSLEENVSNTVDLSAEVQHSSVGADMSVIKAQDTKPTVIMDESKSEDENRNGNDCSKGSVLINADYPCIEEQSVDNSRGVESLPKETQSEKRDIAPCVLGCFLNQTIVPCKQLSNSQGSSTCASDQVNIETSSISNGNENCYPTADLPSVCQLERTTPGTENESSKPGLEGTSVISGNEKHILGVCQVERTTPGTENKSSKPGLEDTSVISENGKHLLGVCQLERTTPGTRNESSKPELDDASVISRNEKQFLGVRQLGSITPEPENEPSKPEHAPWNSENEKLLLGARQLERTTPGPGNESSKPEHEDAPLISENEKQLLGGCQLERTTPGPENESSKLKLSGNGKDLLGVCLQNPEPEKTFPIPNSQEKVTISYHRNDSPGGCRMEVNQPESERTSTNPGRENSTPLYGQKCFTSDDEHVERGSFGFLESCFGLKSTPQNTEGLKRLEHAHVEQVSEGNWFNHTEPPVLLKIAFETNNQKDGNAQQSPPKLCAVQRPGTSLDPSNFKTPARKLQPVVILNTMQQRTCDGKKYHCFKCNESTQSVDELLEHYHCVHSFHKSQYCPTCDCYLTGDKLVEHVCGDVKFKSPTYTKELTGNFICNYCEKVFVRKPFFEEHKLMHILVTDYRCGRCGLYFPDAVKCHKHNRKLWCKPLKIDPFAPTSKSTLEKTDFPDGIETADTSVDFRNCYVKLMDVYQTSESPEKMHCRVCGKNFRLRAQLKAHLKSHLKSHSDEKPYKCDNCGKAFKYSWNVNKHKKEQCFQKIMPHEKLSDSESTLPKYKCPLCFRLFTYSYNRTRHLREQCLKDYMTKGKGKVGEKYRCPLCKDVFTFAGNRNRHIKQTCLKLKTYTAKGLVKKRKLLNKNAIKRTVCKVSLTVASKKALQYKCTFCPAMYSSKSGFYSHVAKHKLLAKSKKAIKFKYASDVSLKASNTVNLKPSSKESAEKASLPLSCRFCGKTFAFSDSLKRHLQIHKGNKPFRCLDCGKTFARHAHLMTHKNVHKRNVQCSVCWEVLPSIGDLLHHRQSHPKKGMLKCPDCPLEFKFPVFLLRHVAVHERRQKQMDPSPPKGQSKPSKDQATTRKDQAPKTFKEEFKCGICQEDFADSKALTEHCLIHMPESTASKCQFCKRVFSAHAGLVRHIRLHTGEKPFACLTCDRHFSRKEYLKAHEEKCHVEQPPPMKSPPKSKQKPAEHSVDTTVNKPKTLYYCSYCPHVFRFSSNLKLHEKAHLAKSLLPCTKCKKYFRKKKYKKHVELCDGDKLKPACRKCGRVFSRSNYRNGHEKQCQGNLPTETKKKTNDTGNLKQKCPQCSRCFRSKSFLQKHLALHSKEMPYACMHCGQKFESQDRYLQHEAFCDGGSKQRRLESLRGSEKIKSIFSEIKSLTGVPGVPEESGDDFKCKFCRKSFMWAKSLRRHILTHTEVKPYQCKTCKSGFTRYDHLKVHQTHCKSKKQLKVQVVKMSLESLTGSSQSKEEQDEELECKICCKRFSAPSDQRRHMAMLHITEKPYSCKRCGKMYTTVKSLKRHNETIKCKRIPKETVPSAKHDVKNQPCRETSKLLQRIQVHYMNKFQYQCKHCPRRFKLSGQLKVHERLHTGEKPYGCANCGERFIRRDYLKRHLSKCNGKVEQQEKVLCDKCGDLFTREALSGHQKTCVVNSKSSGSSREPKKDESSTRMRGFSCANCSERFILFSQLQQHFLTKHRSDQPQGSNDNQQKLASSQLQGIKQETVNEVSGHNQESSSDVSSRKQHASSSAHMRIHQAVYPFSCTKCHVGFWTKKTMENHKRKCRGVAVISNNTSAVERGGDVESTQTDTVLVFNKGSSATGTGVLQTKFSCKDQEQDNLAEKEDAAVHKYQCSECDQSFTDGLRLISHLEEHGREELERKSDVHKCHVCSKVFAQVGVLHRHLKIQHQEQMNTTCKICCKKFRFPSDLDIHKAYHDPSRPFACDICKMRFWTDKSVARHHRMSHPQIQPPVSKESAVKATTEQIYRCEPCDKTYTIKKSYLKHCKTKHKPDSVQTLNEDPKNPSPSASQASDKEESDRNLEDADDSDNDSDSAPYFPCHVCGKTFVTSESLEDHQRCHLGEKPFECEECGKCFFQLANLQQHQRCHKSEFQCQMCGKGFVSLFSLRKHKQTHIRKSAHRCTKCHLSFTRSTELAEHMITHRDENFPCDLCDETFSCKTSRAEHRKMHTEQEEELPPLIPTTQPETKQETSVIQSKSPSSSNIEQYKFRCGICQLRFPDPEELSEHGCSPAKERPYSCPECNKHFLHGSHLKKHQLSHQLSGQQYRCNHCSMSFTHHHLFLSHLRSHGNEKASKDSSLPTSEKSLLPEPVKRDKIYQCPICPSSFYQALDLANHLSVHSHMCSVCNMTFPTQNDLDEHEQCHLTAATQYECTECGDHFIGSDAFRRHRCSNRNLTFPDKHRSESSVSYSKNQSSRNRFQAGDEEEEVDVGEDFIICPICKRRFSSNSSLMEHHKKHHEDPRPFKCLVCQKDFTKKRYLTQHQQIHSERPYHCDMCSESFKTETSLVTHRKIHDANRQHQCPICSRTYLTAKDLSKHKRKHTEHQSLNEDSREYRCDMCNKSFTMFAHLQKHQESHVGQVVYECTECDKAFAFLNLLEEHQQTHAAASTESLQSQSPSHFPY